MGCDVLTTTVGPPRATQWLAHKGASYRQCLSAKPITSWCAGV